MSRVYLNENEMDAAMGVYVNGESTTKRITWQRCKDVGQKRKVLKADRHEEHAVFLAPRNTDIK